MVTNGRHPARWWWFYDFIVLPFAFVVFLVAGIVFDFVTL